MLSLLAGALVSACAPAGRSVTVGAKNFTEQRILAHMLADRITASGKARGRVLMCGDTFGCQHALLTGDVDMLVEYSATARIYYGLPARPEEPGDDLAQALAERGLTRLVSLGFSNDYVVAVAGHRAHALQLERIADLARMGDHQGIRFAVPGPYPRRPTDGLRALLRFHGLHGQGDPLVIDDPVARARALFEGRADTAILYSTDSVLDQMPLETLEDALGFFPDYRAEVWARRATVEVIPGLTQAAAGLAPELDAARMRSLTGETDIEGTPPRVVARRFLARRGLLPEDMPEERRQADLRLAVDRRARLGAPLTIGVDAMRRAFRDRTVSVLQSDDPVGLVTQGRATLALLGAEAFFEPGGPRPYTRPRPLIEAAAVTGAHYLHALRRGRPDAPGQRTVGIAPAGSSAAALLEALQSGATRQFPTVEAMLAALAAGELDAALVFAPSGDTAVADVLQDGGVRLVPARGLIEGPPPVFLRPARLPPGTYPGQPEPVTTFARQIVLAAAAPEAGRGFLSRGPLAAAFSRVRVLSRREAERLAEATGITEPPDPVLPTTWSRALGPRGEAREPVGVADTILNLAVVALLGWAVWLVAVRGD